MSDTPTLYEWAGRREAIGRMIDHFYDRVERDDLLSPLFPGGVSTAHREHVTTWWCEVFGGPAGYTERLGVPGHTRPSPAPRSCSRPRCPTGAGAPPRPTSPDAKTKHGTCASAFAAVALRNMPYVS